MKAEDTRTKKEKRWHEMGKLDGRRDVVEWIENHPLTVHSGTAVDGLSHYEIDYSNLKAKLKEWGIDNE